MSQDTPQPTGPDDTTPQASSAAPEEVEAEEVEAEEVEATELDAYYVPAGTAIVTGPSLIAKLGAEAFGAFFLVLAGLGVGLYASLGSVGAGTLGTALAFGIAVIAGISAVGHVSGGHFNPAVTFGAALAGRTPWKDVVPYWLAQLVGGAIAAAILFVAIPSALPKVLGQSTTRELFSGVANGFGAHSPLSVVVDQGTQGQSHVEFSLVTALLIEVVVTAVFVGVILGVTDRRVTRVNPAVAIGLTLSVLLLIAVPVTNGSLNPARSTAAAIFASSWAFKQLWLFWVAPLVGAAISGLVYRAFAAEPVEDNLLEEDDVVVTDEDLVVVEER